MSSAIQNRLRSAKAAEDTLNKLSSAISLIANEYGMPIDDISNLGAIKIRIRSLMAAMDARKEA